MFSATSEMGAFLSQRSTCDAFLGGRIRAYQPRKGPRAAIDALFLAAAVPARAGRAERMLEAGQGSGVASLALAARVADVSVTGVEIQPELCELARRNAALNGMQDRVSVVEADLTAPQKLLPQPPLTPESFAHVAANPPYMEAQRGRVSPNAATAIAHSADEAALAAWTNFLSRMAAPGGTVTIIHRADAVNRLLALLQGRFGALTVFPLFPHEGEPASRIVIVGVKGSRAPLRLLRGMVLHASDGSFTGEAEAVLTAGEGLDLLQGLPTRRPRRRA